MTFLSFFRALIIFSVGRLSCGERLYIKNKSDSCLDFSLCDGTVDKPLGSLIEAFFMIKSYEGKTLDEDLLEILLEPNTLETPYVLLDSEIRNSLFLLSPFKNLNGKLP